MKQLEENTSNWRNHNKDKIREYNRRFKEKNPTYMKDYMRHKRQEAKEQKVKEVIRIIHKDLFNEELKE